MLSRRGVLSGLGGVALSDPAALAATPQGSDEIHLMTTYVANISHFNGALAGALVPGQLLTLSRAENRAYDPHSVEVHSDSGSIGYLPRRDSAILARLIDCQIGLKARVATVSAGSRLTVQLTVSLDRDNALMGLPQVGRRTSDAKNERAA